MRFTKPLKSQRGFTLIEALVVISITSIMAILLTEIFLNIVQLNVNATRTNDVRSQGEVIMETITRDVRSADTVSINTPPVIPTVTTKTKVINLSVNGNNVTYDLQSSANNILRTTSAGSFPLNAGSSSVAQSINIDSTTDPCIVDGNNTGAPCSYFEVTPATFSSPAQIKIVLTIESKSPTNAHTEYKSRQTLTQGVVQLGQYKK